MEGLRITDAEVNTPEPFTHSNPRTSVTIDTSGYIEMETFRKELKTCGYCFNPCDKKCSNCFKVHYCSTEHQKLHRKIHKEHCFPAVEQRNDEFGRHLVATKTILPGIQILKEPPLVIAPFGIIRTEHPICLGCCKILPGNLGVGTQICQKCLWPLCKQNCEGILWHSENECEIFKSQRIHISKLNYEFIMSLRILLLKEKDPVKFNKLLQLESHIEIRRQSRSDSELLDHFVNFIYGSCKLNSAVYPNDIIDKIFGASTFNAVQRTVNMVPGEVSESGIYQWTSKLSHNCIPNVESTSFDAFCKVVRLIPTVEIRKGDVLCETYIFHKTNWLGIVERRKSLYETYNFWCTCLKCSDPTELGTNFSAIKCKSKDVEGKSCSGFYLPKNSLDNDSVWICNSGNINCTPTKYSKLSNIVNSIEHDISLARNIEEQITILNKHANVSVHENHFTLMKLRWDLLSKIFGKLANSPINGTNSSLIGKMKEMAEKCLEIAEKFTPGLNKHRGFALFYLAHALYYYIIDRETQARITGHGGSEGNPNLLLQEFRKIASIREEAKRILKNSRKDSSEYRMYEYIIENDKKFSESQIIMTVQALTLRVFHF